MDACLRLAPPKMVGTNMKGGNGRGKFRVVNAHKAEMGDQEPWAHVLDKSGLENACMPATGYIGSRQDVSGADLGRPTRV